jgi:hypothetical protein
MDGLALSVFLLVALVITQLVSRVGVEALWARRHGTEAEQVYEVALRLMLLTPDKAGGIPALKVLRSCIVGVST